MSSYSQAEIRALIGEPVKQKKPKTHKVPRNKPCPCGAKDAQGRPKKFKHCCYGKQSGKIVYVERV